MSKPFVPKSIFKISNPDGTTSTATEWDFGQIGSGGLEFIPGLIGGLLLSIVITPILFLISTLKSLIIPSFLNYIGIVIGIYFLIDCYNQWLFSSIFIFLGSGTITFFVTLNIAVLISNIVIVLFGNSIANSLKKDESGRIKYNDLLSIWAIIFIISLNIGYLFAPTVGKGYIKHADNIKYCIDNNLDYQQMNNYMENNK